MAGRWTTSVWNGPPTPKRYEPTQITIQLSMIVVITSCAPTVPLRKPAMPASTAPATMAPRTVTMMSAKPGRPTAFGSSVAISTAAIEPARYWPWPPMLKRPHRNAKATARPVRTSGTQRMSVCWRFAAASEVTSLVFHGNHTCASVNGRPMLLLPTSKNQDSPEPRKISRYVSRVSATLPVVRRMTMPPTRNASTTVRIGTTMPPAFWRIR